MSKPLVSIIIPTFNRAALLPETIYSILAQTWADWECIIVDDGSTDNTEKIVAVYAEKDSRISYHKRPDTMPKGANACRNFGFYISKGEYINWFDSDDVLHPEKFELQVNALENSEYGFSVCQTLIFKESPANPIKLKNERIISASPFVDYMGMRIGFLTQAPMWKRSFLVENGFRFDEELQAAQEWEFHSRILFHFRKYHTIDKPLVFLRFHEDNITNDKNSALKRHLNYLAARVKIYKEFKSRLSADELLFFSHYFIYTYNDFKKRGYNLEADKIFREYIRTDMKTLALHLKTGIFSRMLALLKMLKLKRG
jgi:glycosyltransferase involved in cell wall biosynthesis